MVAKFWKYYQILVRLLRWRNSPINPEKSRRGGKRESERRIPYSPPLVPIPLSWLCAAAPTDGKLRAAPGGITSHSTAPPPRSGGRVSTPAKLCTVVSSLLPLSPPVLVLLLLRNLCLFYARMMWDWNFSKVVVDYGITVIRALWRITLSSVHVLVRSFWNRFSNITLWLNSGAIMG